MISAHGLDDGHLVGASVGQHHVELGFFSSSSSSAAASSSRRPWRQRSRQTSLQWPFDQVIEFQDRHAVQRGQKCVFIECHFDFLNNWVLRGPKCCKAAWFGGSRLRLRLFRRQCAQHHGGTGDGDISWPQIEPANFLWKGCGQRFTPLTSRALPAKAPPRITNLSLVFANRPPLWRRPRRLGEAIDQGPVIWSATTSNWLPASARRARVFFRTPGSTLAAHQRAVWSCRRP